MRTLTYTRPHHLRKLHDELLALPALRPVPGPFPQAVMTCSGDGSTVTLGVPDNAPEAAIDAVVAAHDPTPPPPTADESAFVADVTTLKAYTANASPTAAQTVAAVKAQTRMLRRVFAELKEV